MEERISDNYYNIIHCPEKAWNTFSNQISHLQNDLFIVKANTGTLGAMPADILRRLETLKKAIEEALK